jgi:hypothetical protein
MLKILKIQIKNFLSDNWTCHFLNQDDSLYDSTTADILNLCNFEQVLDNYKKNI